MHFRDDLEPGRSTVELAARDRAGNTTRQAWSFDVVDEDRYGVADRTVRAARNGRFAMEVQPRGLAIPGMRYDVRLTATSGNEPAHGRLTLRQRQG